LVVFDFFVAAQPQPPFKKEFKKEGGKPEQSEGGGVNFL